MDTPSQVWTVETLRPHVTKARVLASKVRALVGATHFTVTLSDEPLSGLTGYADGSLQLHLSVDPPQLEATDEVHNGGWWRCLDVDGVRCMTRHEPVQSMAANVSVPS